MVRTSLSYGSAKPSPWSAALGQAGGVLNGPFRGAVAVELGLVSRNQLAGRAYRRLFPDVYAPSALPFDLRLRSRGAYVLVADTGGVLAGYSAALLLGADCEPSGAPAEVLVPGTCRRHPGLAVRYGRPDAADVTEVGGCRVTSPLRTAWDLCRRLDATEAVVALDALARAGRFAPADLLARRDDEPGARGCRRLDAVVAAADPCAESPPETRLRLQLIRAGLPRPEVQFEIRDEFGFVLARTDLAYPGPRVAIEYDGATHFTRQRREADLQRDTTLAGYGWQTLRVGRHDIGTAQLPWQVRTILEERRRVA